MVFDSTVPPRPAYSEQECASNDPTTHKREFCQMTKPQLYELAVEHNLAGVKPNMRKPELIELLEGAGL